MKKFTFLLLCTAILGSIMLSGCGKARDNTVAKRIVKDDVREFMEK